MQNNKIHRDGGAGLYRLVRRLIGLALGFYFRRIERFHVEAVPATGPVLFASNHPNSLTDSFVIGAAVPRKVNFVATVRLFRLRLVKALLLRCGVIPINRVTDDPRAMRTVSSTFEGCYRVLERGEAVGIFPEGITYDDSRLKEIKSGAARLALELEHRHQGRLGLVIVPVGLTFSAKERYRSDALVNFGEPISVGDFVGAYADRRKECVTRLTAEIERRIQGLILHIPALEQEWVVAAVQRLCGDRLRLGAGREQVLPPAARELALARRIAEVVERVYRTQPERAAAFAADLAQYERWLARLRISDADLALFPRRDRVVARSVAGAVMAILGAPVALYGWVHRLVPYALVRMAVARFTASDKRKAQTSTAVIESGIVAFGLCYGLFILAVYALFGWPVVLWYALSLPVASLLAYYYVRNLRMLAASLRSTLVLLRAPWATRRLLARRARLIARVNESMSYESLSQ